MPARTGKVTYVPGKGSYTRGKSGKAKSFSGKGPAPSGSVKTPEATAATAPTVTVSTSGKVTTSGFGSKKAARQAQRAQERRQRRRTTAILNTRLTPPTKSPKPVARKYSEDPAKVVMTSKPNPEAKPPVFQGHKTAGAPTRKELSVAAKQGGLKVNAKGFVTTPTVRQVSAKVRGLEAKAKRSKGPLPGLDAEGTRVARKVLSTGKKEGAGYKELLAAAETGLVESGGFHNLHEGDADSEGWRQERTSIFGSDATNPKKGAQNFFSEAKGQPGATAGELAANVQRPAAQFRGRYQERKPEANAIVKRFLKGQPNPKLQAKLQQAQGEAAKLGLKVGARGKVGPAPPKVVKRFKAIKVWAKKIAKEHIPYVYGGGHNGGMPDPSEGLDCSSSSVYLLRKAGVKIPNITSGEFGNYLPPGPGAVTVFYNPTHVFLRIGDEYWGTSAGDSGNGGLGPHPAPSSEYLSQYSVAHVPGLGKKEALQLGFGDLGAGSTSFPGVTLSDGGTTATVTESTTVSGEPGFSKKPIRLTPRQVANRTERKLQALSATVPPNVSSGGSGGVSIADLEAKYGRAAV